MDLDTTRTNRYDSVEGLAPSARTSRLGTLLLAIGLSTLALAILIASVTLCVVAGFGIELAFGSLIAMGGVTPVLLAARSRKADAGSVPVPIIAD